MQLFAYNYMNDNKAGWMLLDPAENEQNAERVLKVWEEVPEVRRPSLMLAVLCSFKRAAKLAEATSAAGGNDALWKSMAKVPSTVLHTILERAYFHPDFVGSLAVPHGATCA